MTLFKPHQLTGAAWLANAGPRLLLADGMRVGKTPTVIKACDDIGARSVLVSCPGIARENWAREFRRWSYNDRPIAVIGKASDPIEPEGVTILSPSAARNADLRARLMRHEWDVLVADESQDLKEPTSQRTGAVLSANGLASRAENGRIWFLSGTPLLNHPAELWVMLRTMGRFGGSYVDFLNGFCDWFQGEHGPFIKGLRNVPALKELLAPVMLRRTWREVAPEAPEPEWHSVELDPALVPDEARRLLDELEADGSIQRRVRRIVEQIAAGQKVELGKNEGGFMRLRSATAIAKAAPLATWAGLRLSWDVFDKLVIFAHHTALVDYLADALAPFGARSIQGSTKDRDRQERIDSFKTLGERRVLVVQDNMGRTAIDLTAASHLLFAELDTVPSNNAQASFRVQGHNQRRPVHLYNAILPVGSDAQIGPILARKSAFEAEVLGA